MWVGARDRTIKATYLLALLLAEQHGVEVKHFQTAKYYNAVIDGRPPPRKRRRSALVSTQRATILANV